MTPRALAVALPLAFAVHVAEEAPGFVAWFNSLVTPPITTRAFLSVNLTAMVITLLVAIAIASTREPVPWTIACAWVGFVMLANGLFHLIATAVHGRYSPGAVSGAILYLPLSFLFLRSAIRDASVPPVVAGVAALAGGVPMYAHGFLIVFRGSRLF